MGVPLHVALRGIEKSFDSHAARPRNRSVKSLMYCQEEVEAQFAEWLESQRGASAVVGDGAEAQGGEGASGSDESAAPDGRGLPFPRPVIAAPSECRAELERAPPTARSAGSRLSGRFTRRRGSPSEKASRLRSPPRRAAENFCPTLIFKVAHSRDSPPEL